MILGLESTECLMNRREFFRPNSEGRRSLGWGTLALVPRPRLLPAAQLAHTTQGRGRQREAVPLCERLHIENVNVPIAVQIRLLWVGMGEFGHSDTY